MRFCPPVLDIALHTAGQTTAEPVLGSAVVCLSGAACLRGGGALAGYRRTADRKAGDEQAKTEICQERGGGPQRDAAAAGNRRRSGRAGGIPSGKRRRMGGTGPLRHPGFARRKGGFFGERTAAQISRRAMRILHERYTTAGKSITLEKQNDRK